MVAVRATDPAPAAVLWDLMVPDTATAEPVMLVRASKVPFELSIAATSV
mgnify:CR=1 FL=1